MENLNFAVIHSLTATFMIILIYAYLYFLYRERCMGIWAVAWTTLMSRYLLFDSGILSWKDSLTGFFIFQMLIIISALLLLRGIYDFIGKPFDKGKLFIVILILTALNTFTDHLYPTPALKMLFPILVGTIIGAWLGIIYIRLKNFSGIGHLFTGSSYLAWDIFNLTMPFAVHEPLLVNFGYAIGGFLRLSIGVGTLLVYFEKVRFDLINKEKEARLLSENAADIIYHAQIVPTRKIRYISPAVYDITGYKPEEFYADVTLPYHLVYPEDRKIAVQFLHSLEKDLCNSLILRIVNREKKVVWIEQKCVSIYNEQNEQIAIQGIIRDISERKHIERLSSSLDKINTVRNMAASVAHEIRNPMTTVHGYLQLLSKKSKYKDDQDKFLLMMGELDRANMIIEEYLSLSRKKALSLKASSLPTIIQTVLPLLQASANDAQISISTQLDELPQMLLDENEIRQLILNIVRNGLEAMPQGGVLTIGTYMKDHQAILFIRDQGSGIPKEVLKNIGTPFVTTKSAGTGLGLSVCYQIAAHHHADIKIETSTAGTTFFICFDLTNCENIISSKAK